MKKGLLIVIDGIDGSGKSVQAQLLCEKMVAEGHTVVTPTFPRYDHESSYFIRSMLKGEYRKLGDLGAYTTSTFYSFDRMDAAYELREEIRKGKILISNRYTSSNVGHQGGRIKDAKERKAYYAWLDHFEYEQLHIPRPDVVLYLHVPVPVSMDLVHKRSIENGQPKDIYEEDQDHLEKAYESYREAASLFSYWDTIECMDGERLMSPEEIHEVIWERVAPLAEKHRKTA